MDIITFSMINCYLNIFGRLCIIVLLSLQLWPSNASNVAPRKISGPQQAFGQKISTLKIGMY